MIRETTLEAYEQIKNSGLLSERRLEVYDALFKVNQTGQVPTASELFYSMKESRNPSHSNVTTRLGELRDIGVVRESTVRTCAVTGRNVLTWEVTGQLPSKLQRGLTLKQKLTKLTQAAHGLREAQKNYMQNRGNDEYGKLVAEAATNLDNVLGSI